MPATTDASRDADRLLRGVFNDRDMAIMRERAETIRERQGPKSHLGANHYFDALVELGWSDVFAVRLAAAMFRSVATAAA